MVENISGVVGVGVILMELAGASSDLGHFTSDDFHIGLAGCGHYESRLDISTFDCISLAATPSLSIMEVSSFHPVGLPPFDQADVSLSAMDDMDIDMDIDLGPVVVDEPAQAVSQL